MNVSIFDCTTFVRLRSSFSCVVHFLFASLVGLSISLSGSASDNFQLTDEEQQWLQQHREIKIGAMDAWPPLNFVTQHGQATGIGMDYVGLINKRLGNVLVVVSGSWKDLYDGVKNREIDALLDFTPKPERDNYFNATQPYLAIPHAIVAPKNIEYLRDESALKGRTIALEKGFGNVQYFQQHFPSVVIKQYKDTELALDAVVRGEVDAYAGNRTVALYLMGQQIMSTLKVHGRLRKEAVKLAIGVRKDWAILAGILDKALANITQDEVRRIQSRWMGEGNLVPNLNLTASEQLWLSKHKSVTIAFDGNYPPYSYLSDQGRFEGIAVDIANRLANRMGVELKVFPNGQWQQLYRAAQEGKVDIIATLVERPGRENWFAFTRPYISLSQYFVARKGELEEFSSAEKLSNKKVALIKGYSTTEQLLEEQPGIEPHYVPNLQRGLEAVAIGDADATVADIGMANHLITKYGIANLGFAGLYTDTRSQQRMGVRQDWPQLATILDKALETIEYQELMHIYAKWNVPPKVRPEAGFISVREELTAAEKLFLQENPVIRLASDFAWPPFETVSEKGIYSGIAADYLALLEERLGIQFVVSPRKPWVDIMGMLERKELDVFSCAMETATRRRYASFTAPYISHPMVIVTRNDVGYINGLQGLNGKTIAIEKGYASFDLLSHEHPELLLNPYDDSLSAMLAVSKGEVFAYIGNIATLSYMVREQGLTNIKISGQIPYDFQLALGVRNDWPLLVPILQKGLDSISLEDKNAILQKWIAVEVEDSIDLVLAFEILAVVLLALFAVIYWNVMLNRRVSERTAQLQYQAEYDQLTDLPNRELSLDRLSQLTSVARRNQTCVAVMFLDLDDFKKINDTLGHDKGDRVIVEVAKRLTATMRSEDTISRLGGDEFIILLGELQSASAAIPVIHHVLSCFKSPFLLGDREILLTVSVGIAFFPENGSTPSELLRNADAAMYNAKREGRNTYSFFTQEMSEKVSRQFQLEECMHGALERGEFETYYQPKIDILNKKIIGFEALIRWNSPELGNISPYEFISVAENNGLIIPIGLFVLNNALAALKEWQQSVDKDLVMAVNLSPRQFRDVSLVSTVQSALKAHGISGPHLELEITEGVLLSGRKQVKRAIAELKSQGIKLAMDDFGTGYSSLSYLRSYPFDTLKIDREFIMDITTDDSDKALAFAAIAMAHSLGLHVVAEGVETKQQLMLIAQQGCDLAQGYLFAKPLSKQQTNELLKRWEWDFD
ncbi:MAG: transporter substrate-binding domain-containing protein [Pseudomonadales bacterium]|nr:transporter substrate-binding domain-containing protein [Pseudomonadales bacterium]